MVASGTRRSAIVLYGTETGNAQDIASEIEDALQRLHFSTTSRELDATTIREVSDHDLTCIAISTTGQGDFPSNARKLWLSLLKKKLTAATLNNVVYGLVGLCDSSYPKFNLTARKLHKRLQQLGAQPLLDPCEADEQGEEGTEGAFLEWLPRYLDAVSKQFPLSNGLQPIPKSQKLTSLWTVRELDSSRTNSDRDQGGLTANAATTHTSPEPHISIVLEVNDRVTPTNHWQDVRLLKFKTERPIRYTAGDAVAIRPENSAEDVQQLLEILGWTQVADVPMQLCANRAKEGSDERPDPAFSRLKSFTLRTLLTQVLDINAIPRRSFFSKIAYYTDDETQRERALEFTDPQYLDEYFDYATRPRRSIVEVLQEFNTLKIPWQEIIDIFPIMRPRQFSIASGGSAERGRQHIELLVAIVKYRTVIKRVREGVCTKYLARLKPGTRIDAVLHTEGRFHSQIAGLDRPHLLIAGGTGIAPIRSLLQEKSTAGFVDSTLFFGCRSAAADFFFGSEWQSLLDEGVGSRRSRLRLIAAFSRDQDRKVYVQDRIRENAALVAEIVNDDRSEVIVCGSSGAMPKAVRQALKDALQTARDMSAENAESLLLHLEKSGRYKQETW